MNLIRGDFSSAHTLTREARWTKKLARAQETLLDDWRSGRQGWMGCPDVTCDYSRVIAKAQKFTTLLVIGIGGSDLGARAAWHALRSRSTGMRLEFVGNTDPDELEEVFHRVDWKRTLVNVISKSGDTLEPLTVFFAARERLIAAVGHKVASTHIVATTEENGGALHALARREGFATLPIPQNVGGRFSVLTHVGLFPIWCAGGDVMAMLHGAKKIRDDFERKSPTTTVACRYAASLVAQHLTHSRSLHVLMPYSERLRIFATWYCQLWAESLGKNGGGPTPIAALGATDQHSQLQLYLDGPDDKVVTFLEVEKFTSRLRVPLRVIPVFAALAGKTFQDILHAERAGTAAALASRGRPTITLTIPRVNEEALGALFMFFLIATGLAGELLGVNAYDQSAVEEGKRRTRELLGG